jgi:hypothetical protein
MKKFFIFTTSILIWISPFISFSEAQSISCEACGAPPEKFTLINNFIKEMLINIKTIGNQSPYLGKYVPPSRFDSGQFVPPKQSSLSKSVRRAREILWSALAVERIHKKLFDASNLNVSIEALSSNKALLRDRNKALKIEKDIQRKKFELSTGWGWRDKIWWETIKKMDNIIEKYQDLGILANVTIIDGWAEYGDLILLLEKLNYATKKLILVWGENLEGSERRELSDARTSWEITIMIESMVITEIKENYDCVRRYACEKSRSDSKFSLKDLWESIKNWLNNARSDVRKANANLVKAYSKENLNKVIEEQTLINQLSWALDDIKSRRQESTRTKEEEITKDVKKIEEQNINNAKKTEVIKTSDEKKKIISILNQRIWDTQKDIQKDASEMMKTYATQDVTELSAYFVGLSQIINSITENVVGNKDSEKKCLIKNLWVLCEKQCSNISNKKCYY